MKVEDWGWFEKYKINQFHLPAKQRWDAFWMLKKEHYTKVCVPGFEKSVCGVFWGWWGEKGGGGAVYPSFVPRTR